MRVSDRAIDPKATPGFAVLVHGSNGIGLRILP